jgi:large repetitive protein
VGYWTFDEGSGTTAADSSTSADTATLLNGAAWGTGFIGSGALSLDGVNASASAADVAAQELSGNMAVALWVKHNTLPAASSWMYYIEKGQNSSENYGVGVYNDASGNTRLFFEFVDGTGTYQYFTQASGLTVSAGVWEHVAVVFDHTHSLLTFYNNGLAVSSVSVSAALKGTTDPVIIGQQNVSGYTFPMKGLLDDLRIYNRALSASEVSTLAAIGGNQPPAPPSGLRIAGINP